MTEVAQEAGSNSAAITPAMISSLPIKGVTVYRYSEPLPAGEGYSSRGSRSPARPASEITRSE